MLGTHVEMSWRQLGVQIWNLGPRSDLKIKVSESLLHTWSMNEAFRAMVLDAQRK